ncbi:hypothetical protein BDV25DRAFT_163002 [Aspergillus avenaceus]|uniref:Uncharacterized protein n=1 Tax=Aspergillus avenaceus TaxID=36643 RepID=A0A5N6TIM7_ASPAV|nr:hypothetical protein BDV25DRAFT_163002 [Aspergillus avenaceus]
MIGNSLGGFIYLAIYFSILFSLGWLSFRCYLIYTHFIFMCVMHEINVLVFFPPFILLFSAVAL